MHGLSDTPPARKKHIPRPLLVSLATSSVRGVPVSSRSAAEYRGGRSLHSPVTRYSSRASIFFISLSSMQNPPTSPFSTILALFTLLGSGT